MRLLSKLSIPALAFLLAGLARPASEMGSAEAGEVAGAIRYADQGALWTEEARRSFYTRDQGARLIPYAWLKALRQPDGTPFLAGNLARYGYLPAAMPAAPGLPVGFSLAEAPTGAVAGLTCAACHTRQITVSGQPIRIDGGPAFIDFQRFLADLDRATLAVLAKPDAFATFAASVLGADGGSPDAVAILRAELTLWSARYHLITSRSLPVDQPWGPNRLDAISMILNRVAGLDLGEAPTYSILGNIARADAPARYPFLWNAWRQDRTQWAGFAANGNDVFALSRNLGQVYGVFGVFHPERTIGSLAIFDRNYLVRNSADFAGLRVLEDLTKRIGPPAWPGPIDEALAARGGDIYRTARSSPEGKSCGDCHGIVLNRDGSEGPPGSWKTPVQNVGTDRAEWRVLARQVRTGSLEGATIAAGVVPPLQPVDSAVGVLKIAIAGAIGESVTASTTLDRPAAAPVLPATPSMSGSQTSMVSHRQLDAMVRLPGMMIAHRAGAGPESVASPPPPFTPAPFSYEARVLEGVWAAAPYLHNGSVPTLADLLKPSTQRPKSFVVGPAYDTDAVGLAADQPGSESRLETTGCDPAGLFSGNSNCGHEYGADLPADEKRALLEYLKTL